MPVCTTVNPLTRRSALIGEVDVAKDEATDWPSLRVDPIDEVRH